MKTSNILRPDEICIQLDLSEELKCIAQKIKKDAQGKQELIGRKPSVINSAVVYFAALKTDSPLTMKDLHDITGVQEVSIKKMIYDLSDILNIKIPEKYIYTKKNGIRQFCLYTTGSRKYKTKCQKRNNDTMWL